MKPLIYLEWVDSAGAEGWHRLDGYSCGLILVRSVGWLMEDGEQHITLAGHLGREDDREPDNPSQAHGWMTIPKCAITKRVELQVP